MLNKSLPASGSRILKSERIRKLSIASIVSKIVDVNIKAADTYRVVGTIVGTIIALSEKAIQYRVLKRRVHPERPGFLPIFLECKNLFKSENR